MTIPTKMTDDEYFAHVFGPNDAWDIVVQQVVKRYKRGLLNLDEVCEQVTIARWHLDEAGSDSWGRDGLGTGSPHQADATKVMQEFTELDLECFSGAESPTAPQTPMISHDLVVSDWCGFDDDGERITNVVMIADANGLWIGTVTDWTTLRMSFLVAVAIGNALLASSPVDVETLVKYGLEYSA